MGPIALKGAVAANWDHHKVPLGLKHIAKDVKQQLPTDDAIVLIVDI